MSHLPDYYTYEKLNEMGRDTLQQHVENSLRARAVKREANLGLPSLASRVRATLGGLRPKRTQTPEWRKVRRIGE